MRKKFIALLLSICMLASMAVIPAAAAEIKDVPDNHWAKSSVDRWVGEGIMEVDEDGNFHLTHQVTRGEFAIMLCKLMGYTEKADKSSFKDLPNDADVADALLKLFAAGVMQGNEKGEAMPDQPIDRQQMAVMLCAAFNLKTANSNAAASYQDSGKVASWAQAAVATLVDKKMMVGDGKNLMPDTKIANGDMARLLDGMIAEFVTENGATVNTGDKNGVVIVNAKNVTIENAPESASIVVAPGAEGASVNVTGAASDITVAAENAKVTVGKEAEVSSVTVDAPKAAVTVNGSAGDVAVTESAENAKVTVAKEAEVSNVTVEAPKAAVSVSGTVANVAVAEGADNTTVTTTTGAKIDSVTTSADKVTVTGAANTVGSVVADAGSANVAVKGTEVKNEGADKVTAGSKPVEVGKSETVTTTPSTGGGGGSTVTPPTPPTPPKYTLNIVTGKQNGTQGEITSVKVNGSDVVLSSEKGAVQIPSGTVTVTVVTNGYQIAPGLVYEGAQTADSAKYSSDKTNNAATTATYTITFTMPEKAADLCIIVMEACTAPDNNAQGVQLPACDAGANGSIGENTEWITGPATGGTSGSNETQPKANEVPEANGGEGGTETKSEDTE